MLAKTFIQVKQCNICQDLPLGPRPVVTAHPKSKIIIIGQAPGTAVHKSGIPWDDKSGNNLRSWMDIDKDTFYNTKKIAIIPMGFCYPGKGKSGDLPPRKECAPQWHEILISQLKDVELMLSVGKYAQDHYIGKASRRTLTDTVRNYKDYLPRYFVLPHPSPRNNIWQAKNKWFKRDVLPDLKVVISEVL